MTSFSNSNSHSMVADAMDYACFLLGVIESRDWARLRQIALSNPAAFRAISETIAECEEYNGMTLLHACVRHDPPAEVLAEMIEVYPPALRGEDCLGRTPLHVAVGTGASPSVVKVLTANYPQACDVQDEDGRTPLHLACDISCELFEDDDCSPREPPSLDTVKVLLAGSLNAVTVEDEDEMNAVEYAIISNAPMSVVNLLQRASQRVNKRSKAMDDKAMGNDIPTRTSNPMGVSAARLSVH